jgi:acyl-coenzyme A thioesterase PaaI-like protein
MPPATDATNTALPSLAEDIEAEFGKRLRRKALSRLLSDAQLAALELTLESASGSLPRSVRVAYKAQALDKLIDYFRQNTHALQSERFNAAKAVIGAHIAIERGRSGSFKADETVKQTPLAAWLEQEERILKMVHRGCGVGDLLPEHVNGRTNVQVIKDMMEGKVHYPVIARTLSFCIVEVDYGRAVLQCAPSCDFTNPMGTLHGGWIGTLLDTAMGTAVFSGLPANHSYTTLSLELRFLARLTPMTKRIRAAGTLLQPIGRKTRVKGWLYGPDEKVYAEAEGEYRTFAVA